MAKKYEITRNVRYFKNPVTKTNHMLMQIRALKDFVNRNPETGEEYPVRRGDFGGWVAGPHNLSQEGTCWVEENSLMFDKSRRIGHSLGLSNSKACENSEQSGYSRQMGYSVQCGNSKQQDFSMQMDYSVQSGNSRQCDASRQKNKSRQEGDSIQGGESQQSGFSQQTDHSRQVGKSQQTGHSTQKGHSVQSDNSLQTDFSIQDEESQQMGNSKQGQHSKQFGKSIQDGNSVQMGYSIQKGSFYHNHGPHSTLSEEGELTEITVGFLEIPPMGPMSMSFNIDIHLGRITASTGYSYPSNENGLRRFTDFIENKTNNLTQADKERYIAMFKLLLQYRAQIKETTTS